MNNARSTERWGRRQKAVRDGASWYAYLCYRIMRAQGYERTAALEETFRRYPHALEHWKPCESQV